MQGGMAWRDFIGGATLAVGTALAVIAASRAVLAQTTPITGLKPMAYDIKPLPFDPKNIKGLSEKLLISHYENNYSGAVRRLNTLTAQLAELDFAKAPVFTINGLKREELIAGNSMILHELYFDGLGDGGAPTGGLADAITRDFGSMDRWRAEFSAMGKAIGGGSGWVLLTWSPRGGKLVNQWAMDTRRRSPEGVRSWRSICSSIPITSIMVRNLQPMSTPSWTSFAGIIRRSSTIATAARPETS
jgi:Fe-Mn family superoxide dismutase